MLPRLIFSKSKNKIVKPYNKEMTQTNLVQAKKIRKIIFNTIERKVDKIKEKSYSIWKRTKNENRNRKQFSKLKRNHILHGREQKMKIEIESNKKIKKEICIS